MQHLKEAIPRTKRADLALVARGLFESRATAQEAIAAGLVRSDGRTIRKASEPIGTEAQLEAEAPYPWVSRGGVKLAAALDAFSFDPQDRVCLDIGASTGGFTDVLLARGAAHVFAVDVGHGQLHGKLKDDPRVAAREGMDARKLTKSDFNRPISMITCDVSFISLKLVLPALLPLAGENALLAALIKPQFEVGPALVVKGIVKDDSARERVCRDISTHLQNAGWRVAGLIASPIEGGDGNREYLIGARAFSSEVDAGSREENASKQRPRAPFRFYRNGEGSGRA
ncbi:MAG: TlyA family RNA methyltransferase [Beijerinckiaceae bacterium]